MTVDRKDGSAVFDFEGTGPEVFGNTNAPPAVTYSAIIYSLRCMVRQEIPLNQVLPCWPPCDEAVLGRMPAPAFQHLRAPGAVPVLL